MQEKLSICKNGPLNSSYKRSSGEAEVLKPSKTSVKIRTVKTKQEFIFSESERFMADGDAVSIKKLMTMNEGVLDGDNICDLYNVFLAQTINLIALSPTGAALIKEAADQGWALVLDDMQECEFCIDASEKLIELDHHGLKAEGLMRSAYFGNMVLINLVKALRDIYHEKRHGSLDTLFSPEAILMLERVRAADCDVIATLVAWELRSEGHTDIWRHCIGSENGDIAMAYSNRLERDPSSQFNGKALKSAFKCWYECEDRISNCDHQTLEYMDDIMECANVKNPFGSKVPTHIAIELLSCLPDKTAYLQGFGHEILMDPNYSGLNDDMNQTHLMHILYDLQVTYVNNVPFRNAELAAKIFPADADGELLSEI
ncbi:MAG: hypothetical protein CMH27_07095 [Micavibrio sp.]|nr:hypothetical protein [Micavibrio sp.]|tara:strand:- start:1364 stop:2479 length:1116 start_codon:yes stop_codon:yes gene_type:complete